MFKDKTIVYTSGTFDMFHYNHLRMINYARSLADILIVGVSTDELVSSYKAKPIIPFHERLQIIEALKTPDIVIPQHSLDHTEIVKKLNIDAFVVGDDWFGKYDYIRLYASGNNLLTWAAYDYIDPESGSSPSWDTPPMRTYTFGLEVKF